MPTSTFLKLPKEKQEKIINVSKLEFSKYGFYDASINKIIKEAGISRGSFYQYFENKEDVFIFIMDKCKQKIIRKTVNKILVDDKKYDIFEFLLILHDSIIDESMNTENSEFIKTTICNMNMKLIKQLTSFINIKEEIKFANLIKNSIDLSNLNLNYLKIIPTLIIPIILGQISIFFVDTISLEESRKQLELKIDVIKHGILKR